MDADNSLLRAFQGPSTLPSGSLWQESPVSTGIENSGEPAFFHTDRAPGIQLAGEGLTPQLGTSDLKTQEVGLFMDWSIESGKEKVLTFNNM